VEIKDQLDATDWFSIAKFIVRSTCFGHLCPSSGAQELYRWLLPVVLGTLAQAATICITLELLMMGIMVPETC